MFIGKRVILAAILAVAPFSLHAQTITVGVAANFSTPLSEIITKFQTANPGYYVTTTSKSTGQLQADIIAGGTSGPYDLFLAANAASPIYLHDYYSSLVVGDVFTYAQGYLELWSNKSGVDISAGLPTNFTKTVIANVPNAPYGVAASQILAADPYYVELPDSRVDQKSDITATYNSVADGTYDYGFVAKSQICLNGSFSGVSHHSYTSGYDAIIQDGIKINRTARTSGENTVLAAFVTYLQTSLGAGDTITKYCYTR
ncbi:molybdate ABC transporter substrate-binding protein [Magnetospirillum sp. 15-1]|uniref:molybdate ABC transporter substrate-binding protein n=1 Tax=Magnetospirillum sp. 15-1 TaxID=1979370 RepID=UPI000BBBDDD9|nr:molybdate ABC transporter substrate-binding protein [Magnetospirillum sp. 15-1]